MKGIRRPMLVLLLLLNFVFLWLLTPWGIRWRQSMTPYTFYFARGRCEAAVAAAKKLHLPPNGKARLDWNGSLDPKGDVRVQTDGKGNYAVSMTASDDGHMGRCTYHYSDVQAGTTSIDSCSETTQLDDNWSLTCSQCD